MAGEMMAKIEELDSIDLDQGIHVERWMRANGVKVSEECRPGFCTIEFVGYSGRANKIDLRLDMKRGEAISLLRCVGLPVPNPRVGWNGSYPKSTAFHG